MAAYLQPPMTPYLSVIQCSINLSQCKAPQYCDRFEFKDLKAKNSLFQEKRVTCSWENVYADVKNCLQLFQLFAKSYSWLRLTL